MGLRKSASEEPQQAVEETNARPDAPRATATDTDWNHSHPLPTQCARCGSHHGVIREKSHQFSLFCACCGTFQKNLPHSVLGLRRESVSSTRGVPPAQRSRILERAHLTCELCFHRGRVMHVAHYLSRADVRRINEHVGREFITEAMRDSDDNLLALCEECNLGQGRLSMPLWLVAGIVFMRATREANK